MICVRKGNYRVRVIIKKRGEAGKLLTFVGYPRRKGHVTNGFEIRSKHVELIGFDITHDRAGWNRNGIWLAGNNLLFKVRETDPSNPEEILADPLFVNPGNPLRADGIPFTGDDGLILKSNSPAIGKAPGNQNPGVFQGKGPSIC